MMAKRPDDRPASYDEVLGELERASPARSRPAGFWPRSLAAFLDLIVGGFLSLPAAIAFDGDGNPWLLLYGLVIVPIVLARFATTAGHALLDLEIVPDRVDGKPSLGSAVVRTFVELGPLALGMAIEANVSSSSPWPLEYVSGALIAIGVLYPPIVLAHAAWMSSDARTLWDRAAHTRVRYRVRGRSTRPVPGASTSLPGSQP